MRIVLGQGVYYRATREGIHGKVAVETCRGDEDNPEDRQEARDEERACGETY